MSLEADIVLLLTGPHGGDSPEFGANVFPDIIPQRANYPACAYEIDFADNDLDLDGNNGYAVTTVAVTLFSKTKQDVVSDYDYLLQSLHGFYGSSFNTGTETKSLSSKILLIEVSRGQSFYDNETQTFQQELDLEIHTQK